MPRRAIGTLAPLIVTAVLAACGSSSSSPPAASTESTSTTASTTSAATVSLRHVPTGDATLAYDTTAKTLTVEIRLTGLAPSSSHPAHIHSGLCEKQGAVLYPLNAIQADAKGVADSVTVVQNIKEGGIPNGAWYVNVHNGPGLTPDAQFEPIVCGDVANPDKGAHLLVKMQNGPTPVASPPSSPDQTASGTAMLSIEGGALKVVVNVSGLKPSSSHAMHIHMGSCESQGPVVHGLPALVADATGTANLTTTVAGISSIPVGTWYLNIHRDTMIGLGQTDFDPILCGDIGGSSGY